MKLINIVVFVLFGLNISNAQDAVRKPNVYRTWVTFNDRPLIKEGFLYGVEDSSILVANSLMTKYYSPNDYHESELFIPEIKTIKLRKNNSIGKGMLIGAVAGFAIGGILGIASGDDPPCNSGMLFCYRLSAEEKALITGLPLSLGGAGLGLILSSFKVKIPLNGSMANFNKNREILRAYAFKK